MASASREIHASVHAVFAALADPTTYPTWLAGASDVREVEDGWPAPGSKFFHQVGVGPFTLRDSSMVLDIVPDRSLRLAVRARPVISAVVTFTLVGDDERCVVTFEEEPAHRLIGNLVRPVLDPITHVRNHWSLERLDELVAGRSSQSPRLVA